MFLLTLLYQVTRKYDIVTYFFIDQCQHAELVSARENNKNLYRAEEEKLIGIHHSERNNHKTENRNKNNKQLFSTGTLSHGLFLRSVYKHAQNDDFEATTYQDKWVSVDYIFYRFVK